MNKQDRKQLFYLEDIELSIKRIQEYIAGYNFDKFLDDQKTIDAVIRNFEIIGEASKNVNKTLKSKYPQVPWNEMYYLRNKVSHEYFGIDHEIIWDLSVNYLQDNLKHIQSILKEERKA